MAHGEWQNQQAGMEYPQIHAWKTSLHSFEHCFLGYMISSYHRDMPFHLYYAFMNNEEISHKNVNPYFLRGNIEEFKKGESVVLNADEQGRRIWDITFSYLH